MDGRERAVGAIEHRKIDRVPFFCEELHPKIPVAMTGGGYIFSSDHSIPTGVDLDDYLFILQEARQLGTYA